MTQKSRAVSSLVVMTFCAVVQVIAQVFFQVLIAQRFGAGASIDAFSTSLALPTAINAILAGSIGYVIMPMLVPLARDESREAYRQLACSLGIWSISVSSIVSLFIFLLAPGLVAVLFSPFDNEQKQLTIALLQILAPLIVLGTLQGWLQAIENSQSRFIRPALASVVGPSVATLLIIAPGSELRGVSWLGWALVIGSLAAVMTMLPTIRDAIPKHWKWSSSATSSIYKILPLVAINSYTKLDPIIDRVLLAGLTVGSIAHLNYAQRFVTALVLVVSSGLSTLAFSDLAGAAHEGRELFRERVADNLRRMLIFVLPVVIGILFFSVPTIRELLERGEFKAQNTQEVAGILAALSGFFAAATLGDLIAKAFYSLGDTRTPSIIGAMAFTLGIGLKMIGVHYDGVRGLALGSSAYYLLSVIAMSFALSRRCDSIRWRVEVIPTVFRVLIATIFGGVGAYGVLATSIAHIWWLAAMVGAGIYGISLWLLGEPTWSALLSGKERAKKGDSV